MPDYKRHILQLQKISRRELSEKETSILDLWAKATAPTTRESAAEAARRFDEHCPPIEDEDQVAEFFWMVWNIMLDIASSCDVTTQIQEILVRVVVELRKIDRGVVCPDLGKQRMWKDMPDFGIAVEASCSDPTDWKESTFTREEGQSWVKFNKFEALLLEAGAAALYSHAIWVLKLAFEEELPTTAEEGLTDCRVLAASVWVLHGAEKFFRWAQENLNNEMPDPESLRYLEGGSLYSGTPNMCPERWEFWRHRLEQFGRLDSGLELQTREAAMEAVQAMRTVEANLSEA